jgi:Double zinc ribbon/Short C-terminal domain
MECEVMVSNEEIKRMLENRRKGIKTEPKKEAPSPVPPEKTTRKPVSPASQTCESCGAQNPQDAKFCIKCGETLKGESKVEAEEAVKTAPAETLPRSGVDGIDYRTCPNCSHQNQPQAKFCVVCGHKLEDVPVETSEPEPGSLLDRVQDTPRQPEDEEETPKPVAEETTVVEEAVEVEEASTPMEAEVIEEEAAPEEVAEEPIPEEIISSEKVPEEETVTIKVPEDQKTAPEEVAEEMPEELPQVKTFKFGGASLEREEAVPVEGESEDEYGEDTPETAPESVAETVPPAPEADPVEKIKKAKELLDIGAITEEEFEEIKKKYLALI